MERPLRNSVFTGLKSDLERNSSKSGAFLFSLMLAEKGAAGEDKTAALESPMIMVSQAGGESAIAPRRIIGQCRQDQRKKLDCIQNIYRT